MPLARHSLPLQNPESLVSSLAAASHLRQLHAHLLVTGHLSDAARYARLVSALALSSPPNLSYAHLLLARSPHPPSIAAHNSLLRAHSRGPDPHLAFAGYRHLPFPPDNCTFTFLVGAAAALAKSAATSALRTASVAASVHAAALRHGHAADPHVGSKLVSMYAAVGDMRAASTAFLEIKNPGLVCVTAMVTALAECGNVDAAWEVFDEMAHRDHVAWNAMISGYVHAGRPKDALRLFGSMQEAGVDVREVTLLLVLSACGDLGALDQGKWVHSYVERRGLRVSVKLGTSLVDMYAKCGAVAQAVEVFEGMRERNVYTWTSMITGLAANGKGRECLELFKRMKGDGVEPNGVTFTAVLHGCAVAGLVEEGLACFNSMTDEHGIKPRLEHYGCLVNLYGRAGRFDEVLNVINTMPVEPHDRAWGALLNACRIHKNAELGKYAMEKLMAIQPKNDAAHVLLSNIYAESRNWSGVSGVRELMKARGVKKEPACSVMEVGVHRQEQTAFEVHRDPGEQQAESEAG